MTTSYRLTKRAPDPRDKENAGLRAQRDRYAQKWIDAVAERDAAVKRAGDLADWLREILSADYADQCQECGVSGTPAWEKAKLFIRQLSERG